MRELFVKRVLCFLFNRFIKLNYEMEMKFLLLSMMFMFTLKECTLYTKHIKNYKPQKLSVDESFPKKSIKLIDKIKLEENEEVIISTINSIEILDGGLEFLIIDPSSKKTVVFNYMDGSIKNLILQEENWLRYFVAEKPHPISVAIKGKLKYINTIMKLIVNIIISNIKMKIKWLVGIKY